MNETPWSESVSGRFKQQPKAFRHKPDAIRYHSIEKSELARLIALLDYFLWWSSNQVVSAESSCQSLERWIYIEWTHSRLQVNVLLITFWRGMAEYSYSIDSNNQLSPKKIVKNWNYESVSVNAYRVISLSCAADIYLQIISIGTLTLFESSFLSVVLSLQCKAKWVKLTFISEVGK